MDAFFRRNVFFKRLRQQIDGSGMNELLRAMEPVEYSRDQIVIKYGGQSSDCYFLLKGQVVAKTPMMHTVEVLN